MSFPLKLVLQQKNAKKDVDVPVNVPVNVPINVPINVPVNPTETQRKILELITQNANITHSEMAKVLSTLKELQEEQPKHCEKWVFYIEKVAIK